MKYPENSYTKKYRQRCSLYLRGLKAAGGGLFNVRQLSYLRSNFSRHPAAFQKLPFNAHESSDMSLEREVRAKIAGKRDFHLEQEAKEWIEEMLDRKFPPNEKYEDIIRDGIVLCEVMNKLSPGAVHKINTSGGHYKMMENINNFQHALKAYGVPEIDMFQTVDLFEKKDIAQVTVTLFALGKLTYRHPEWTGPYLGPMPAEESKEELEERLAARRTSIGLQAGSKKGQNMGTGRKIMLGN